MDFKNIIDNQIKESMLNKSKTRLIALRAIKSAILLEEKSGGSIEKNPVKLLMKLIKQRKDSIEAFNKANRKDLIDKEMAEIEIIESFLPKQKNYQETKDIIENIIKENNFVSIKDMGKLMNIIKSDYIGQLDMGEAGKIAKSSLGN